ncbi:MAG: 30S ribosomal protein THX [Cyclobacteriaceae bacterium]|jgi:ribosomal small subunit protein bTHX
MNQTVCFPTLVNIFRVFGGNTRLCYTCNSEQVKIQMGRGDKKSKRGKRWRGSYGVSRNRNKIKTRLKRSATRKKSTEAAGETAKPKRASRKKAE